MSIKVHSTESKLVIGPSNNIYTVCILYCLGACMCELLTPEILDARAVKGLMVSHLSLLLVVFRVTARKAWQWKG